MSREGIRSFSNLPILAMPWFFALLTCESNAQPLISTPWDLASGLPSDRHLIWLYFGSNLLLVFSCLIIPALIFYYLRKKPDLEYRGLFWLFALFILSSGATHLTEVMSLWWPGYFIQGWAIVITAMISLLTLIVLIPRLSDLLSLPSRKELQQEIEHRQRAQNETERLSRSRNDLIEASSDLVWEVDAQWCHTYLSSKVETMLGYTPEEMLGRTPFEFMAPKEAQRVSGIFRSLAQEKKRFRNFAYSILSRDGREIQLESSGIPILEKDGNVSGYRGVGRDITEILSWQSALLENEEKFRRILQTTSEGFWLIDPITKLTLDVNESLCNMLGLERQEMIGHAPSEFVDSENAQIFKEQMAKIDHQDHRAYDIELLRKNGSNLPVHFEASTIRFPDGTPRLAFAFVTDISNRMIFQKSLIEAKSIAEAASRTQSAFLDNISHEIRTPMNAIIGMAHLAMQSDLTSSQRNYIEKINIAANSLLTLITDLLDFSKMESGKIVLEHLPFRMEEVLDLLYVQIHSQIEKKELKLRFELANDLPSALVGDAARVGQILLNLALNAIKFTEHGEIVISISVERQGDTFARLHFSVRDTGVGIPKELQSTIFNAFSQADDSSTRRHGGTGLGLAICKRLGDLMRGELRVESAPNKGSTFHFLVWLEKQSSANEPHLRDGWVPGQFQQGAEKHLARSPHKSGSGDTYNSLHAIHATQLEIDGVDVQSGLVQTQGDMRLYSKLLLKFAETKRDTIVQLSQAIQTQDWKSAQRLAHTLKGVAGSIGAASLQKACQVLEEEMGRSIRNPASLELANAELQRIVQAIDRLKIEEPVATIPPSSHLSPAALAMLEQQINQNDTAAVETAEKLQAAADTPELIQSLTSIVKALNSYDFEKASKYFKQINGEIT